MKNQDAEQDQTPRECGRDPNDGRPLEELSPEMRRAVESIRQEMPPEGLTQAILDGVRRLEQKGDCPNFRSTKMGLSTWEAEHHRQRRAKPWNFTAGVAIGAMACTLIFCAISLFLEHVPTPEAAPRMQPMQTSIDRDLPTAWAYHKAIGQSPETMDAMLDRHARQTLRPEPKPFQASAFFNSLQPMP